jgi:ribosomal protein S12 methylthiotransferase
VPRAEGYATAPTYAGADLVIVNTCGFIDGRPGEFASVLIDRAEAHDLYGRLQ